MQLTPSDAIRRAGWKCLGNEFVQTFGTAKALCPTIPANTKAAIMTVRTATIVLTFDGSTTPTSTVGNDYGVRTEPYTLNLDAVELAKILCLSATGTVYISYFGNK
jgi:hypothetical protein